MTPRQLESRIRALRGSLRRLLALHGLSWVLGIIVPLVILAGFSDWLFQLDSVIRAALLAVARGRLRLPGLSARTSSPFRPVRRSRYRHADRGAVARLERPPGEHHPVRAARRQRRSPRLAGPA